MFILSKGPSRNDVASENITFTKSVDVVRDGNYQMGGCNTAIFVGGQDNFMVEMESYGEEKSIYPGETIDHSELWQLTNEITHFKEKSI